MAPMPRPVEATIAEATILFDGDIAAPGTEAAVDLFLAQLTRAIVENRTRLSGSRQIGDLEFEITELNVELLEISAGSVWTRIAWVATIVGGLAAYPAAKDGAKELADDIEWLIGQAAVYFEEQAETTPGAPPIVYRGQEVIIRSEDDIRESLENPPTPTISI